MRVELLDDRRDDQRERPLGQGICRGADDCRGWCTSQWRTHLSLCLLLGVWVLVRAVSTQTRGERPYASRRLLALHTIEWVPSPSNNRVGYWQSDHRAALCK